MIAARGAALIDQHLIATALLLNARLGKEAALLDVCSVERAVLRDRRLMRRTEGAALVDVRAIVLRYCETR